MVDTVLALIRAYDRAVAEMTVAYGEAIENENLELADRLEDELTFIHQRIAALENELKRTVKCFSQDVPSS